ncbi:MAG: phage portal protein [Firmicutes bacterium]|nr:phage portal protein [Bacillota bacterium]
MGIINKLANLIYTPKVKAVASNLHADAFLSGEPIGIVGGLSTQLKLSYVYACLNILSNSISKLPFFIMSTKTAERAKDIYNARIKYLLSVAPNPMQTASQFHKLMELDRLVYGNAYAKVVYNNGTGLVESITRLENGTVQVLKQTNGTLVYQITTNKGKTNECKTKHAMYEIIHLRGMCFDGVLGQSVLSYAANITNTASLMDEYSRNFYLNGGRPTGAITVSADLSIQDKDNETTRKRKIEGIERVRKSWKDQHAGAVNAGIPTVLQNGMTYQSIPHIPPKDMVFIESKQMNVEDIARFFGIPLFKLQTGSQNYNANEQNAISFVVDTLNPIVIQYEQEYSYKLLQDKHLLDGYSVKGNLNNEMRGDIKSRTEFYTKMSQLGVFSINKILAYEDEPAIEHGDIHMVSLNYAPIDKYEEYWDKKIANGDLSTQSQTQQQNTQGDDVNANTQQ